MSNSLVLITRPNPDGPRLAARLEAEGLHALWLPAFDFEPCADVSLPELPNSGRRLLVFTSPRAVRYAARHLGNDYASGARVAALGPATAQALEDAGWRTDIVPRDGYTSERLLAHRALDGPAGDAVIFTAPGGREALYEGLTGRGWTVHVVPVYRRRLLAPAPKAVRRLEAAEEILSIWTSGVAMRHLLQTLSRDATERVLAGCFLVISARLEALATELGARRVERAPGPGNRDLLTAAVALQGRSV